MKSSPFFSIAIPTFNRADDLKTAIKYILKQTYEDFEIVISDNASADYTKKVVDSFKDKRIKYFKNKRNIQVLPNVKKAISLCRGEYIFLQGDDDFLVEKKALSEVFKVIQKTHVGFLRLNYLSFTPDRKKVFDFRASKGFDKNTYLKPNEDNLEVINFLLNSDPSFLAGLVFINKIPSDYSIFNSQLYSWFRTIFYATKKYGGFYVNSPYIIAGWSQWRVRDDNFHSLYSLEKGKLTSEKYLLFVKNRISENEYKKFLREQLLGVYVKRFLAIKLFVGNKNMLELAARIITFDPSLEKTMTYRLNLLISIIAPRFLLLILRKIFLWSYIMKARINNNLTKKFLND